MKIFLHVFFIILIALVTFFGLGPVLLADGVIQERLFYGIIVVILYIVLGVFYRRCIKRANKK